MLLEGLLFDYASMISFIESKKRTPSIVEIEALLYGHETRLVRYNKETQALSSPSLNYTQGYSHSNSYKSRDSGSSQGGYGHDDGSRGGFANRGADRHSDGSGRGPDCGRFAYFQCQIFLKFGHTANVCHFRSHEFSAS